MPSVCFYFQVHQPYRLSPVSRFDLDGGASPFDETKNREIMLKVAEKCYLPANQKMLELIKRHKGNFRISYSLSGVCMEQMEEYAPSVIESFRRLADTGCVEFLAETYYHSLSAVYNEDEFREQVKLQSDKVRSLFGVTPTAFRNTELIFDNRIADLISSLGYETIVSEGPDDILSWRSPNFLYNTFSGKSRLLVKNYRLSDDIAFRFSNRGWSEWPLTADKFASWVHQINGAGEVLSLFMDYETFGEHQWESTGIFNFLDYLPGEILKHPDWGFLTPTEAAERYTPKDNLDFFRLTSWADEDRDLTAWRGNTMQWKALERIYKLASKISFIGDPSLTHKWRKLQTSDHYYYMCTKWFADGDVHAYFSPYSSPYDAYIYFCNVMNQFEEEVEAKLDSLIRGTSRVPSRANSSITFHGEH